MKEVPELVIPGPETEVTPPTGLGPAAGNPGPGNEYTPVKQAQPEQGEHYGQTGESVSYGRRRRTNPGWKAKAVTSVAVTVMVATSMGALPSLESALRLDYHWYDDYWEEGYHEDYEGDRNDPYGNYVIEDGGEPGGSSGSGGGSGGTNQGRTTDTADSEFPLLDNLPPNGETPYGILNEEYICLETKNEASRYLVAGSALLNGSQYVNGEWLPIELEEIEGLYYERESNTLYMKDFTGDLLNVNLMGNGFTIYVAGENTLNKLLVWGFYYGGSVTITGPGKLTINEDLKYNIGLELKAEQSRSALMVDNTVTLDVYGVDAAVAVRVTGLEKAIYYRKAAELSGGVRAAGDFFPETFEECGERITMKASDYGAYSDHTIVRTGSDNPSTHVTFTPGEGAKDESGSGDAGGWFTGGADSTGSRGSSSGTGEPRELTEEERQAILSLISVEFTPQEYINSGRERVEELFRNNHQGPGYYRLSDDRTITVSNNGLSQFGANLTTFRVDRTDPETGTLDSFVLGADGTWKPEADYSGEHYSLYDDQSVTLDLKELPLPSGRQLEEYSYVVEFRLFMENETGMWWHVWRFYNGE